MKLQIYLYKYIHTYNCVKHKLIYNLDLLNKNDQSLILYKKYFYQINYQIFLYLFNFKFLIKLYINKFLLFELKI